MGKREPCVYVSASGFHGTVHTGVTFDPASRVQPGNGAFGGFAKRRRADWSVRYEAADTIKAAAASEKRIQNWPRDWKKNPTERDNPPWRHLAPDLGLPALDR